MKAITVITVCLVFFGISPPSAAHRFSTSFFVISEVENDGGNFDWQWRLVRHDFETLVPGLLNAENINVDMRVADFVSQSVSINAECQLNVLPMEQRDDVAYAGQNYVHINGRGDCGGKALTELSVVEVFKKIDDHKVILSIEPDTNKHVLSKDDPSWIK
ncbi:hypothetical protein [Pseudidiomarina sp.]|uniref:hypothetical protein n=1 Tax=Pseudidiomarina sp. TaxID=2081707 RepID=UPI003A98474A